MAILIQDTCNCYNAVPISQCVQQIKFNIPSGNYLFVFKDKFNSIEQIAITSTTNVATLNVSDLTEGLFNANAGLFFLQIFSTSDLDTPIELTFDSVDYTCFVLTFVQSNSTATYEYLR